MFEVGKTYDVITVEGSQTPAFRGVYNGITHGAGVELHTFTVQGKLDPTQPGNEWYPHVLEAEVVTATEVSA